MKPKIHKKGEYNQGCFSPKYKDKYKGSWPIVYRSSLELKAFRWMDNNNNIICWGSESVIIPYKSALDEKIHRYFVDLVAHLKRKDGTIQKILIEVKPHKFLSAPTESTRKSKKTLLYEQTQYIINSCKWEAAKKWCEKNNCLFLILTEKDLKD